LIEIIIDLNQNTGSINFVGTTNHRMSHEEGTESLANRSCARIWPRIRIWPADTRLWAALQAVSAATIRSTS